VDTADGKPNPEWMLLRAHKSYDVPLEAEPSKWAELLDPIFDEVKLYRYFMYTSYVSVGVCVFAGGNFEMGRLLHLECHSISISNPNMLGLFSTERSKKRTRLSIEIRE